MKRAGLTLLLFSACATPTQMGLPPRLAGQPIPIEYFAQDLQYEGVKLSPDGRHFALAALTDEGQRVLFLDTATSEVVGSLHGSSGSRVSRFAWANDERVLVQLAEPVPGFDMPLEHGGVLAVNLDSTQLRTIFGRGTTEMQTGTAIRKARTMSGFGAILHSLPQVRNEALVVAFRFRQEPKLFRVNIYTGVSDDAAFLPGHISFRPTWHHLVTDDGTVIVAVVFDDQGVPALYFRPSASDTWSRVDAPVTVDARLISATSNPSTIYLVDSAENGPDAVYAIDPSTGERRVAARHATVDPTNVLVDRDGLLVGVLYDGARPEWFFPDASHPMAEVVQKLAKNFDGERVSIVSRDTNDERFIVHVSSSRNPGTYYLLNNQTRELRELCAALPGIEPKEMAQAEPFSVTAKDGVVLHGYLTRPVGADKGSKLPMVVLVHDGPDQRAYPTYDGLVQLLASRGYAVLQLNFRGSSGFGQSFYRASEGEWGGRVQEDLLDATRWAVAEGIADGKRVCIAGDGFGAYSALRSASLAPDLFRCAAGISGIYDLADLREGDWLMGRSPLELAYLEAQLGSDLEKLKSVSPVHQPQMLTVPVLLAHGGQDRLAPPGKVETLASRLRDAGNEVELYMEPGEGRSFLLPAHRRELYSKLLTFLDRHTAAN